MYELINYRQMGNICSISIFNVSLNLRFISDVVYGGIKFIYITFIYIF